MKRLLSVLVLLLIVDSAYAPLYASAKPVDSKMVDAATGESTISKWGGATSLKVKPRDVPGGVEVKVEERIGAVEYSWILAARPATNVFSLELTFTGCAYYYQPPLDAGAYPKGWTVNATHALDDRGALREYRPIDVVGSYAVYGPQRNGVYGTGKVAHIYRPLVTDAGGKTIWGIMDITGGVLTVTVDQKWLDGAKYPVVVDPTFGNTNAGASEETMLSSYLSGCEATTPVNSNSYITGYAAYVHIAAGGPYYFKAGLWANTDGGASVAASLSSASQAVSSSVAAWKIAALATGYSFVSSTTYQLALVVSNTIHVGYDAGAGVSHIDTANSYATPEKFDWVSTSTRLYSLYALVSSTAISDVNDTDNVYAMKDYYTFTTVITDAHGAADIASISVSGKQGAAVRWTVDATSLNGVPAYTLTTGGAAIDLDTASCTFTESGLEGTLILKIRFEWDATNEADCELAVTAVDAAANSITFTNADYFDVVTRLVTRDFTGNVTSTTINSPVEVSGKVRYALGPTYVNASASYPPNAQFTSVKIYDDESTLQGTDAAIVNGFFNVTVTTGGALGSVYYHAYLDLVPDYVDGNAVDGDLVAISIIPDFGVVSQIPAGFVFFGANITEVYNAMIAFTFWFSDSATNVISLISSVMNVVTLSAGSLIYWLIHFVTFFTRLFTEVGKIFNGTGTLATSFDNMWTYFGFTAWVEIVPMLTFLYYVDQLPRRSRQSGRGFISLIIGDLQVISYLVGEVWGWSFTVFNFVVNMILTFVGIFMP